MQDRSGILDKDKSQVVLVDDQHKDVKGKAFESFEAAHDARRKLILINTRKTDISKVSSLLASTGHEVQRAENAQNPRLKAMSAERQEHMARSRGDNLARVHRRLHGRTRGSRATVDAFHRRNKDFLNNSSSFAAKSRDNDLKPREYNWDRKTGQLTYVSDKGGDDVHYFNRGTTNAEGKFETDSTEVYNSPFTPLSPARQQALQEATASREGGYLLDDVAQGIGHVSTAAGGLAQGLDNLGGTIRYGNKGKVGPRAWKFYSNVNYKGGGRNRARMITNKNLAGKLSRYATRVGGAVSAYSVWSAGQEDEGHFGPRRRVALAREGGGSLGGWAGARAGFKFGARFRHPAAPLVFGAIGALTSSFFGSEVFGRGAESLQEQVERDVLPAASVTPDAPSAD